VIWPFPSMEVLCGFSKMIENVGIIGDRTRQLGEIREYWIGRLRVVWIINSELHSGSPRLCRLRPRRLGPNEQALIMYCLIRDLLGPANVVASCVSELDNTLPHLWMSRRDSIGPPIVCPLRHTRG
jgi:hypothetical protein